MQISSSSLVPGETLRILVISTREATHNQISEVLSERFDNNHRLYWISQPELAATRLRELVPQVIVVDDELGGAELAQVVRQLAGQVSNAAVMVLVDAHAMALARQAVLAGARAFVAKPLVGDEFVATLRQVIAEKRGDAGASGEAAANSGRVVVFCAPKGGTGRTTIAVNTTISLQRITNKRVVLVDADYSSPALDVVLNLHDERDISDLLTRLSRLDGEVIEQVLAKHASGVRVLLSPAPSSHADPIPLAQVQQIVAQLKRMYDWVIVDLGLPLDATADGFLDASDRIVMTVMPEMVGLRNTRLMLDQLASRGHAEQKVWLVTNRATIRGGVSRRDIEQRLHAPVHHVVPDDQPLASLSINRGVPLVMSHPRSAVARAMGKLAQQLVKEVQPALRSEPAAQPRTARSSLVQRWWTRLGLAES